METRIGLALARTLEEVTTLVAEGGFVMPPLVVGTFLLWYALSFRFLTLRRGAVRSVRVLLRRHAQGKVATGTGLITRAIIIGTRTAEQVRLSDLRKALDDAFSGLRAEMRQGRVVVKTVVIAAPLAGLLGTVTGMIETFDSLADMALFSQSGGIAGGISQALLTTQMGLSVAAPGVVVGRLLDRRQDHLETELEKLQDILCSDAAERERAHA